MEKLGMLDYLVSKMSIKGTAFQMMPGGAIPDMVANDVYAALAFGDLSINAYVIGSAIHNRDHVMINQALAFGTALVDQLFTEHDWSATKPFQMRVNQRVRAGQILASQASVTKTMAGELLKSQLANLAIFELLKNGKMSQEEQAKSCEINYSTWKHTWQSRYGIIWGKFHLYQVEFEDHMKDKI